MKITRRRTLLTLLGTAAMAAGSLPFLALAGPGAQAPNLRADPPENVSQPAVYFDTEGGVGDGQLLVRFDGFVTNVGAGPLEVSGNPQITNPANGAGMRQRARAFSGGPVDVVVGSPPVQFESQDSHDHFHLMRAMRYSLWNLSRTAQAAPGQKVGFCLYDIQQISGSADPQVYTGAVTSFCDQGNPGSTDLRMGTSAGWRDVYDKSLAYQWVDVSNTSPGQYVVGAEADPEDLIWEGGGSAENNAPAFAGTAVTVPGWVAQPLALSQTGAAQPIVLSTQKFGTQSDSLRRFRVTSPPSRGTLSVAAGSAFTSPTVTYTPNPGYTGPDSFRYVAFNQSSPFPREPVAATVTIADATPSVAISGAPASLVAGTSAQLTAQLANLGPGVNWSATAGSITPAGLYTAPAAPPSEGIALIRATSAANPAVSAEVAVGITPAPVITAKPDPFASLTAGSKPLSALRVKRITSRTFVAKVVTGRRGGRLTMTVAHRGTVLKRKTVRLGARKGFTYKVTVGRGVNVSKVRVVARFTPKRSRTDVIRRAGVPRL